jgi:hypothetical protein
MSAPAGMIVKKHLEVNSPCSAVGDCCCMKEAAARGKQASGTSRSPFTSCGPVRRSRRAETLIIMLVDVQSLCSAAGESYSARAAAAWGGCSCPSSALSLGQLGDCSVLER